MPAIHDSTLPSGIATAVALFRHPRRGLQDPAAMPRIESAVSGVTLDPHWLARYRECIGLAHERVDELPPLALQIAVAPLHLAILANARFPFRALGLVHASQRIEQTRAIPSGAKLELLAYTTDARWEKRGMSFGLVTEAILGGECAWRSETRALARVKTPDAAMAVDGPRSSGKNRETAMMGAEKSAALARSEEQVHVPESCGRRYAAIAGDLNPIHQHALLAKPFGFKRAIVHGTWTLGRALVAAKLPDSPIFVLDARFRRPVELPSDILIRTLPGATETRTQIRVSSPDGGTVYVVVDVEDQT